MAPDMRAIGRGEPAVPQSRRSPSGRSGARARARALPAAAVAGAIVAATIGAWAVGGSVPADASALTAPPLAAEPSPSVRSSTSSASAIGVDEVDGVSSTAQRGQTSRSTRTATPATTTPRASAAERDVLVETAAQARRELAEVAPVLLDESLAPAIEAELAATDALLARWYVTRPVSSEVNGATAGPPLVGPDVPASPSLWSVPSSATVTAQVEALTALVDRLPTITTVDGVTSVNGVVVVNKTFGLPADYEPGLSAELVAAFDEMASAARADGVTLWIGSGFRSYTDQRVIYDGYAARHGSELADTFSARPGHSEHQSGLAIDLNDVYRGFATTPAARWVAEHAHSYGFVVRYPEDKEDVTGYKYEAWHLRYVGVELASVLHEQNLTLEEYLGVRSSY